MNGDHSLHADFRGIIEECALRAMDEDAEGVPEWERFRVISDEVGIFLYITAGSTLRKRIIEMGGRGGAGSSIIWLAGAASRIGGEVVTWEANPRRWVKLQNSLSRARLSPHVQLRTIDPLWPRGEHGGVIAPPAVEASGAPAESADMVVVSVTEPDWPQRMSLGWDVLEPGGLVVLTDTFQASEAAEAVLGEMFQRHPAAVAGFPLGEGVVLASKLAEPCCGPEGTEDAVIVGDRAAGVLEELQEEDRLPGSRLWAIPPETGRFLWILTKGMGAKSVLEIGTSSGYSGTWIACALQSTGGSLTTIEIDPEKVAMARKTYERSGVADWVTIIEGDARAVLPCLEGRYDMVFLDCDKEFYGDLLEPILLRLRRGGLLIADNVTSHREELRLYVEEVKRHSSLASVTVPVGSGEELTMVL